jgi:chromosome segregation ATPase
MESNDIEAIGLWIHDLRENLKDFQNDLLEIDKGLVKIDQGIANLRKNLAYLRNEANVVLISEYQSTLKLLSEHRHQRASLIANRATVETHMLSIKNDIIEAEKVIEELSNEAPPTSNVIEFINVNK